jgi:hypothetical protein
MKILAGELETLRARVQELDLQLEQKLEITLEKAVSRLKSRVEARQEHTASAGVDTQERQHLIAETAYLKAEQRGFKGGDPAQDWKEAEAEIDRLLLQGWSKHRETPGKEASRPAVSRGKAGTKR